jgi:hypothetical protein
VATHALDIVNGSGPAQSQTIPGHHVRSLR